MACTWAICFSMSYSMKPSLNNDALGFENLGRAAKDEGVSRLLSHNSN